MIEDHELRAVVVPRARAASLSLGSALFLSLLVVIGLAALAFWPSGVWAPPGRPGLKAPIVFDEFVNPPNRNTTDQPGR